MSLPVGWAAASLGDVVAADGLFVDGDWVESKDQDPDGDVRLVQLADVGDAAYRNKSARFLTSAKAKQLGCTFLRQGDVLVARMPDPLGRACIFPGDPKQCVTVVDVCVVRTGALGVDHRWLMYAMNAPPFRSCIAAMQSGSTRKRISRGNLAPLHLPVPPLAEQRRIVAAIEEHLSRLDAAAAGLKRVQAQLPRYRAAVLKTAMAGGLTATDSLAHDAGFGMPPLAGRLILPPGWTRKQLSSFARTASGGTPRRDDPSFFTGPIPWVKSGELGDGLVSAVEESISESAVAASSAKVFPKGTLCIALYGATVGKLGILAMDAATNQAVAGIFLPSDVDVRFMFHFLRSIRSELVDLGKGGAQPNISQQIVRELWVPLPPHEEQIRIVDEIDRRLSLIEEMERLVSDGLVRSERLRQSVLARAFSGRLVPQDPNDEPASVLLERIRAGRAGNPTTQRKRGQGVARR